MALRAIFNPGSSVYIYSPAPKRKQEVVNVDNHST